GTARPGDQRPCAVEHDAAGLVLVQAEEDQVPGEVSRLRGAANDRRVDLAGERIRRAEVVLCFAPEERRDVAEGSGADAEHVRILDRVGEPIKLRRVEGAAIAETDANLQGGRR